MRCNPAQTYQSFHTLEHNILYGLYTLNRTITHKINVILYSVRSSSGKYLLPNQTGSQVVLGLK